MATSVLTGGATVALVIFLPRAVGTTWASVGGVLGRVSALGLVALAAVWIAGLWAHTYVLAASLPGLTKRRGLTLSLTGSAVSNVLPLGGAAGTGLNFAMTRRWGFSSSAFGGFLTVTTLVNIVAKLGVVAVALALAPIVHTTAAIPLRRTETLLIPVLAAVGLVIWALASGTAAAATGRALDRMLRVVGRRPALASSLPELRRSILRVFRAGWLPMTAGIVAYLLLQLALLWLCFQALGSPLSLPVLVTGLAVERLLTLIPITPGGVGVVEVGTSAALVAMGGDPAVVTAGLLLFRGFTYLLEIPVGGLTLAIWLLRNRRTGATAGAAA